MAVSNRKGLDLAGELRKLIAAHVIVHNDVRLGAVAERWHGAVRGANDVVYPHVGVRMGTGYLIEGRRPSGFRGAAGELTAASAGRWVRAHNRLVERANRLPAASDAASSRYAGRPR